MLTKPYFVKNSRWTGWNPYSKDHPYLQNKEKLTQKHLCDYGDFSLWVWDYVGKSSMVVAYHPSEVEVGYVGYYPEGYCISVYVDPDFRNRGLGKTLIQKVPVPLIVFDYEVGPFNKRVDRSDPLVDADFLLSWYDKLGVLRYW
jgi:GNAT superfamily N-acetyltransferase